MSHASTDDRKSEQKERIIAALMLLLTVCTTTASGLLLSRHYQNLSAARHLMGFDFSAQLPSAWDSPSILRQTASFPVALLTILLCHEMGHYVQARRWKIPTSLPFFIPSVPPLGTLGAVIRMQVDRPIRGSALLHMAATGPIAGMVPAVVALWIGIGWSHVQPLPFYDDTLVFFHGGLLVSWFEHWQFGVVPLGSDLVWHPVAFAGWAGCLVTALNMLPIGQLDGGHVVYAMWPQHARIIAYATMALLLIAGFWYVGWWLFAALIWWLIGIQHPPTLSDGAAEGSARLLGFVAIILFLLTIHPVPVSDSSFLSWR